MDKLTFDVAHLLAGTMLVLSFLLLYQDRVTALLNVFALQAIVLALSVAAASVAQRRRINVTALVALV
jgi:hydrogenase-4 component E